MNNPIVSDEQLVSQKLSGDNKAFEQLVTRWNKRLLAFVLGYVSDFEAAKDIIQDSWIAIYNSLGTLQDTKKFPQWAYRLVYFKTVDHFKSKAKIKKQIEASTVIETSTENDDVEINIASFLEELPPLQKLTLKLFYYESKSINEIAALFELPVGTIKSRIFYAREHLKKRIKENKYEK
jgi:RNA polymerase sigma-70 factor (ECF subfamily)